MSLTNVLRGTGVALVTPFQQDGSVDYAALDKLIDFVLAGGVEYLVQCAGGTDCLHTVRCDQNIFLMRT